MAVLPPIVESLDPEQRRAALHQAGPALVRSGPGSGKTRVLAAHAAVLIARGLAPERIVAISFTRKAATTLQERLRPLLSDGAAPVASSTIHSLCLRIILRHAGRFQLDPRFSVYDAEDSARVMARVFEALGRDVAQLAAARSLISSLKSGLITPRRLEHRIAQGHSDELELLPLYRAYQQILEEEHALDFDDLLLVAVQMLSTDAEVRASEQGRVDAVLVDEIQDICFAEAKLLALLAGSHRHLFGIGDGRQSIYGFRDALRDAFGQIRAWFPEAISYQLNRNYRSTATIVALGQAIVDGGASDPEDGRLFTNNEAGEPVSWYQYQDQDAEAAHLAHLIAAHVKAGGAWRDWALLIRVHEQSRALELALRHARVPFRLVGELAFAARAEVKDILAYARLAANAYDVEAFRRAAQVPPRGVGDVTIRLVLDYARDNTLSILEAARQVAAGAAVGVSLRKQAREGLSELLSFVSGLRSQSMSAGVPAALSDLVAHLRYRDYLQSHYGKVKGAARFRTVQDLIDLAHDLPATAPAERLEALLDDLIGTPDEPERGGDVVSVLTIHAAKGLEFPCVAVVGVEEGMLPISKAVSQEERAEERRLFYVAATRAAERLVLTTASRRLLHDRILRQEPSPFLDALPGELVVRERPTLEGVARRTIIRPRRIAS
jgi:DNA helicase II / ATP-dependent DNA helicase PcrA